MTDQVFSRHREVFEAQAVRLHPVVTDGWDVLAEQVGRLELVARLFFDQEDAQPFVAHRRIGVRTRQHGQNLRPIGERAPRFGAIQDIVVAVAHGAQLHAGGIRTGVGFGEGGCCQNLTRRNAGQVFLFLLLGPMLHEQRAGDQIAREHTADAEPTAAEFLGYNGHADGVHASTAPLFGERHAKEAQVAHLLDEIHGDLFGLAVILVGNRNHLVFGEFADGLPNRLVFFGYE